ncbi:MAG: hypothetical protein JW725_02985 [Candidatus Babeliaceae bacterium]|nr:hypothetical protein [Candidatus Babeliaceae bacterium]
MRIKSFVTFGLTLTLLWGIIWISRHWQNSITATFMAPITRLHASLIEPIGKAIRSHWRQVNTEKTQEIIAERDLWMKRAIELESMLAYERDLQELLDFRRRYAMKDAIIAQIIVARITPEGHSFLIEGGKNRGITKDMVALFNNHLVGRVNEVYNACSEVTLITDAHCSIQALCLPSRAKVIHRGINKENETSLMFVSHLEKVNEGDLVISYGSNIFPRGFALGKIKSVTPAGVLYQISVEPLIPVTEVSHCLLVKKGEVENWEQQGQPLPSELQIITSPIPTTKTNTTLTVSPTVQIKKKPTPATKPHTVRTENASTQKASEQENENPNPQVTAQTLPQEEEAVHQPAKLPESAPAAEFAPPATTPPSPDVQSEKYSPIPALRSSDETKNTPQEETAKPAPCPLEQQETKNNYHSEQLNSGADANDAETLCHHEAIPEDRHAPDQ